MTDVQGLGQAVELVYRLASAFLVLPKRGVSGPADVERLRTILDRHLERV